MDEILNKITKSIRKGIIISQVWQNLFEDKLNNRFFIITRKRRQIYVVIFFEQSVMWTKSRMICDQIFINGQKVG